MKLSCDMIQDMKAAYLSGSASADTIQAVKSHLSECPQCKAKFEAEKSNPAPHIKIETSLPDEALIEENLRKLSKRLKTRQLIGTVCAVVTAVIGLASLLYDLINEYKNDGRSSSARRR